MVMVQGLAAEGWLEEAERRAKDQSAAANVLRWFSIVYKTRSLQKQNRSLYLPL